MDNDGLKLLIAHQKQYFFSGKTRSLEFRLAQLKKLQEVIRSFESEILAALREDLGKSAFEAYTSELAVVYEEINVARGNLPLWARTEHVPTPLVHQPSFSKIYVEPKGVVLIIAPWNYPFQLLLAPLIGAIAAGNCVVLKPSEYAPATSRIVVKMIEQAFAKEYCTVVEGGAQETQQLLEQHFDHIFFTGSIPVGKIVMRAAAEHLTPVTLELGGKSPCIVDSATNIKVTARRIVWGKFYNCGQTCVAPDYLLVPSSIKQDLFAAIKQTVSQFYGTDPQQSPEYGKIINTRHFDRLVGLLGGNIVMGGQHDRQRLYLAPTLVDGISLADKIMEDEIFGPILPVIEYESLDEAFAIVRQRPNPLACYVFTSRREVEERVINELNFGGGCVNNTLIQTVNPYLPFGGVGSSGMGAYHGHHSFKTFSHSKGIVKSPQMIDVPLRYPPFKNRLKLIRRIMR